jgi:phosphomannomutase/mannose-6-phosphate isomerase-like protein (cupin superfamily)
VTLKGAPPAPTTIVFGTDGWRARIADEFTFENVRRCADGVARYVVDRGETAKGVVVAYDRRFASEHFAIAVAEVLLAHDIPVAFAVRAVPTQMSSFEVVERGAAAGIVITASHNPWVDNGFKVKAPTGAAAGADILGVIEARLAVNGGIGIDRRPFADAEAAGLVERFDPYDGYERFVRTTLDLDALKAADASILVDPMWGAGSGWISRLLAGGRIRVNEIHQERNPYFGGVNPEPIRPNVDEALGILAGGGYDLGLLLDGDADRAGAADERGTFIHQLQVTGLLMYYLAEHRGLRDPVVISINNTSMAGRLGERYGIETFETPVGFKFIGPRMIETGAMMGAEESGGFGFGMHLPERDGVYADLLLLDLFLRARRRRAGVARRRTVPRSPPSWYLRIDVHFERLLPEIKHHLLTDRATSRRPSWRSRSCGPSPRYEGRLQVLHRRRLVAAHSHVGHGAARARLHGGDLRADPGCDARRGRAPGPRRMTADPRESARRVEKPWGHELIWAHTDQYVGKILVIEAGKRLSLQRHLVKDESIFVAAGRLRLYLEDELGEVRVEELVAGDHRHVPTGRIHRYEAIERTELVEVSTPELDDVVRLEDDFGREGTSSP